MKKFWALIALLFVLAGSYLANAAISDSDKYLLNNKMGPVAGKVKLGDLIEDAEEGGLANNAVSLENLDSGITPSHIVVYAGQHTTVGGAAAEAITVTGVAATDLAVATMVSPGSSPQTIVSTAATTNTVTVTFSANPSNDHVINYVVYRAAQ